MRRREVRGTRNHSAMAAAMDGAMLLSGPVEKAAGTQYVHEVKKKTTRNPFQASLGHSLG